MQGSVNGQDAPYEEDMTEPALLDQRKLVSLLLAYPRVHRAIKREAGIDEARHGYFDIMLAEIGLCAGWSDEDIAALIRQANEESGRQKTNIAYCHLMIQQARLKTHTGDLDLAREALLMNLSTAWKVEIYAVIRHGEENSLWHLKLYNGQEIQLGTTEQLMSQTKVRTKIFDSTGQMIPRYGPKDGALWDYHLSLIYDAALVIDTPELTRVGQIRALITGYIESQECLLDQDMDDWEELAVDNRPYVRNGMLYLSPKNLWLAHARLYYPKMTQPELLDLLRLLGGKRTTVTLNSVKSSRSYWRIPLMALQQTLSIDGENDEINVTHEIS
jgi:hypothetical protein